MPVSSKPNARPNKTRTSVRRLRRKASNLLMAKRTTTRLRKSRRKMIPNRQRQMSMRDRVRRPAVVQLRSMPVRREPSARLATLQNVVASSLAHQVKQQRRVDMAC